MKEVFNVKMLVQNVLTDSNSGNNPNSEILRFIIQHIDEEKSHITPFVSYSSNVFLLNFETSTQKFVIKIRAVDTFMKLGMEMMAYKALSQKMTVPEVILYGVSLGYEVVIYPHLGETIDGGRFLSRDTIFSIWELILVTQDVLFKFSSSLKLNVEECKNYAMEVHRYTLKYVGKEISLDALGILNDQLQIEKFNNSITVFSDRGPVNWVINNQGVITPIDFDLLLLEPRLADFIQFIDHHELCTSYSRDALIEECLYFLSQRGIFFSKEDFHWHALYRNLTQGAIFYKVNKKISSIHYQKAVHSCDVLNEEILKEQIKKILKEVAWI